MKRFKKHVVLAITALFAFGLVLNFSGCSGKNSPLGPEEKKTTNLKMVKWNDSQTALKKILQVSQFVTYENGGTLKLKETIIKLNGGEVKVSISLTVFPKTISQDAELVLSLDDQSLIGNVDMSYSPHGVTFSRPAKLEIIAQGLDLSGIDPDAIKLYYDNEETGQWELMNYKRIKIDQESGKIQVIYAEIPHFSRYALAHSE